MEAFRRSGFAPGSSKGAKGVSGDTAEGYCFKTARARATFGSRCYPPYGQLDAAEQAQAGAIQGWERSRGCK